MSAKITFKCDHDGCAEVFTCDTSIAHKCHDCPEDHYQELPIDLGAMIRFLTDSGPRGGGGWEFALDKLNGGFLIFAKCFCPKHQDDIKALIEYQPDKLARRREEKAMKRH